jgi:hypothetical protein
VRQLIVQHSEMRDATQRKGMPFVYTIGDRNAHLLELPEPTNPVWQFGRKDPTLFNAKLK